MESSAGRELQLVESSAGGELSWWRASAGREFQLAEQALLWPRGKTKFIRLDGSIGKAPGHGIVLVGMGERAIEAMQQSQLGMLWDRRAR